MMQVESSQSEEESHRLHFAISSCIVKGGILVVVHQIDICTGIQENFGTLQLAVATGKVQGSATFFVLLILVCTLFKQLSQSLCFPCGEMGRRSTGVK